MGIQRRTKIMRGPRVWVGPRLLPLQEGLQKRTGDHGIRLQKERKSGEHDIDDARTPGMHVVHAVTQSRTC
jgi:hypothetical protein